LNGCLGSARSRGGLEAAAEQPALSGRAFLQLSGLRRYSLD
jgi:hypothetical protein